MISVPARRLLFWAGAFFAFVMAVLPQPPELPGAPSDKVQHLLVGLSLYGAFIELVQAIPALHRDSDIKDWIADTVASGIVLVAVGLWRSRTRGARDRLD